MLTGVPVPPWGFPLSASFYWVCSLIHRKSCIILIGTLVLSVINTHHFPCCMRSWWVIGSHPWPDICHCMEQFASNVPQHLLIIVLLFFFVRKQSQLTMSSRTPPLRYHPPIAKRCWKWKGEAHVETLELQMYLNNLEYGVLSFCDAPVHPVINTQDNNLDIVVFTLSCLRLGCDVSLCPSGGKRQRSPLRVTRRTLTSCLSSTTRRL